MYDKSIYRNPIYGQNLVEEINKITTRPWRLMEICGGQTYAIAKYGIEDMLPKEISLIHGPGCPVCVTPINTIDTAINLSGNKNNIILSFGDMLRVRGSNDDLLTAKSLGGDIRIIYSPLEAIKVAIDNPNREIIVFAIGFETTAPIHAQTILEAKRLNIKNLSFLTALFCVPPILECLLKTPDFKVDGILAAGHVCAITGLSNYHKLSKCYNIPFSVTGFEPIDILWGIYNNILQLEKKQNNVFNAYSRVVKEEGNPIAMEVLNNVLEQSGQEWRGLGFIDNSGLSIRDKYAEFNAYKKFNINPIIQLTNGKCMAASIMKGLASPTDCPHFKKNCTPQSPLGAPMVSSEGVCAAYHKFKT